MKDKKVIVLMGGPSKEAEVSRRTGTAIADALQSLGYHVETLELNVDTVIEDIKDLGGEVVFNAIHGKYGEDGALQGLLEMHGIPYTGSGIMAHAVGMNKKMSKFIFEGAHIPTAKFKSYDSHKLSHEHIKANIRGEFELPVVLKAASQGSSIGVIIVKEESKLDSSIDEILEIDHVLVAETFINGPEFTVGVLDGKALPVIEIRPHSGEYDYASKYTTGATDYLVPAPIPEITAEAMQSMAETVYRELQCDGVIRVDFMMSEKGELFVLEYNTVPGMTATSLVPKAAAAMGMDFPTLCETILRSAGIEKF